MNVKGLDELPEKDQLLILSQVYRNFLQEEVNERIGEHWQVIGFQGSDPATDLRGVGIFGLFLLLVGKTLTLTLAGLDIAYTGGWSL